MHVLISSTHLSANQGPKGGGAGVGVRSPGALKFIPRSPEPHCFVAWRPNIILSWSLEPSKRLLRSP